MHINKIRFQSSTVSMQAYVFLWVNAWRIKDYLQQNITDSQNVYEQMKIYVNTKTKIWRLKKFLFFANKSSEESMT